jgi:hypothetical protein
MVDVSGLRTALAITISTPVKPGSVHRFLESAEFEKRLAEAILIMDFIPKVYEKGADVARGKISSRAVGLGSQLSTLYRKILEYVDVKPLYGLSAAAVVVSAVSGYLAEQGKRLREGLRQALTALLYRSPGDDTAAFIEGLEATGASDLVNRLEAEGLTKRVIRLEDIPLGDVFERLESVDPSFSLNVRSYTKVLDLARVAARGKSLAAAALLAYLEALGKVGYKLQASSFKKLIEADREIRRKTRLDGLLGVSYAATVLVLDEHPNIPVA